MSKGIGFDPSREWLGIDAVDLANPFRVLGVSPQTAELADVAAAAERLLVKLRGIAPGPFKVAHESLMRRIEACRDEALTKVAARPRAPAVPRFVPPAVPGATFRPAPPPVPMAPAPLPTAPPAVPAAMFPAAPPVVPATAGWPPAVPPAVPAPPVPLPATPPAVPGAFPAAPPPVPATAGPWPAVAAPPVPAVAAATTEPGFVVSPSRPAQASADPTVKPRPLRRNPAIPAAVSLLALLAVGTAAFVLWPQREFVRRWFQHTFAATHHAPLHATHHATAHPPAHQPAHPHSSEPAHAPHPGHVATHRPVEMSPRPTPRAHRPAPAPEMNLLPHPQAQSQQEPTPTPQPQPPEAAPGPSPQEIARAAAACEKSLESAYAALRRSDYDAADRDVAAAAQIAEPHETLDERVNAWQQLAIYARQMSEYRDKALDSVNGGREYDIGRTRISVIESTPDRLIYKSYGRVERIPRAQIPKPIMLTILRTWFAAKDQPANHIFLGTYLLLQNKPDLAAVRAEWGVAEKGGHPVAYLRPLLEDPLVTAAAADR